MIKNWIKDIFSFKCRYWKECKLYQKGHPICDKEVGQGCGENETKKYHEATR